MYYHLIRPTRTDELVRYSNRVFSLTSIESVNELTSIRQQILRIKESEGLDPKDVPIVLCGNKSDMERQVPRDVGVALSKLWGGVPCEEIALVRTVVLMCRSVFTDYETSARKRINVDEVFEVGHVCCI